MQNNIKRIKTVIVPHPTDPNKELEIDYEEEEEESEIKEEFEPDPIGANGGKKETPPACTRPPCPPKRSQENGTGNLRDGRLRSVYRFHGMLTNALSLHFGNVLLKNQNASWEQQDVSRWSWFRDPRNVVLDEDLVSAEEYEEFLELVFSPDVWGGIEEAYFILDLADRQITLQDIIRSRETAPRFARLVAAKKREGAGGSAQPGRLYTGGGGGGTTDRLALNLHGGMKHRRENLRQIQYLLLWFKGVEKYGKELQWTTPEIVKRNPRRGLIFA
jgi:hypothetical protein